MLKAIQPAFGLLLDGLFKGEVIFVGEFLRHDFFQR